MISNHPIYGVIGYHVTHSEGHMIAWGDWLSCDTLRGSHDSQSPHIWGDWLSCDPLRGSHDIRTKLFIPYKG